jgi:hypothetical protein
MGLMVTRFPFAMDGDEQNDPPTSCGCSGRLRRWRRAGNGGGLSEIRRGKGRAKPHRNCQLIRDRVPDDGYRLLA